MRVTVSAFLGASVLILTGTGLLWTLTTGNPTHAPNTITAGK